MSYRPLTAVVLAAGEGTRMRSSRPKPLHVLCGRPMVLHVLDALAELPLTKAVVVVGHRAEWVTKTLSERAPAGLDIEFVEQSEQRGTGDAVSVGLTAFSDDDSDDDDLIVLPGDTPLLTPESLSQLVLTHREADAAATLLTAEMPDPTGYGRIVRGKDNRVARIVEHADATPEEREINEICTSIYCFRRNLLAPALRRVTPTNAQGEYYLTDVVEVLHDAGYLVTSVVAEDAWETAGVNDRAQLADAEAELRRRTNDELMQMGVTMLDPERTYVDASVKVGTDVTLFPGTLLQGDTVIGDGAEIGPDTRLVDCVIGERAQVEQTVGRQAEVGDDAVVGPFAVLNPGARVKQGERTGAFFTATAE